MVDDEPDVEPLFRQQFRREVREGLYRLDFALSGEAALHMLDGRAGDEIILLLLDINMPGMSGLDLLPKMKGRKPGLPVFIISAYGDADTVTTALERGADEFLTKPVDFAKLRRDIMAVQADAMRRERMTAPPDDTTTDLHAVIAALRAERDAALSRRPAGGGTRARTRTSERNSEYGERIEHQAATIDVLKAMSASPGDPQPVFDLIVDRARDSATPTTRRSINLTATCCTSWHSHGIETTQAARDYAAAVSTTARHAMHVRPSNPRTRQIVHDAGTCGRSRHFCRRVLPGRAVHLQSHCYVREPIGAITLGADNPAASLTARSNCCRPSPSRR